MPIPRVVDIEFPCRDETAAAEFAEWVTEISGGPGSVRKIVGRSVVIAVTQEPFLILLNERALENGWTIGSEMFLMTWDAWNA